MEHCGVVEGFYWRENHSVEGRYAEFDPQKRRRLLEFMGTKGLNIYVYEPKVLREENVERAYDPDLVGDVGYWRETFQVAAEQGIDFVWGLGPGRYGDWYGRRAGLCSVVELVLDLGAAGFALLFDDVDGTETDFEMLHQAELGNMLYERFPGKSYGLCSGTYCGTRDELEEKLDALDRHLEPNVSVVFTGTEVWPESISHSDLPQFGSGRKCILWDNWMASDTNDPAKLKLAPPRRRERVLWSVLGGYWLNPNFPVERVVHMVSAVGEMMRNGGSFSSAEEVAVIRTMAYDWAGFLGVEEAPILKMMMRRLGIPCPSLTKEEVASVTGKWPSLAPIMVLAAE